MEWWWKVGRVAGVDVRLHVTVVLLFAVTALLLAVFSSVPGLTVYVLSLMLASFVCLSLHELGHVLAARHFGVETQFVLLTPVGAGAILEHMPREPWREFWIALAGPAVNAAIAGGLWLGFETGAAWGPSSVAPYSAAMWVGQVKFINLILLYANLIPAFPLDGGRLLRACMAIRHGYLRGTEDAVWVARALAVMIGVLALAVEQSLLFTAFVIWFGAGQERKAVRRHCVLKGVTARQAMSTLFRTVTARDSLWSVAQALLESHQDGFPVVLRARAGGAVVLVGYLPWEDLGEQIRKLGPHALVGHAMRPAQWVLPDESVESVIKIWDGSLFEPQMPVMVRDGEGRLLGLVTEADVRNLTEFTAALQAREETGLPNLLGNGVTCSVPMEICPQRRAA